MRSTSLIPVLLSRAHLSRVSRILPFHVAFSSVEVGRRTGKIRVRPGPKSGRRGSRGLVYPPHRVPLPVYLIPPRFQDRSDMSLFVADRVRVPLTTLAATLFRTNH